MYQLSISLPDVSLSLIERHNELSLYTQIDELTYAKRMQKSSAEAISKVIILNNGSCR